MRSGNYQDNITQPLLHDHDDNPTAADVIDANLDLDLDDDTESALHVPAIEKVRVAVLHPFTIKTKS